MILNYESPKITIVYRFQWYQKLHLAGFHIHMYLIRQLITLSAILVFSEDLLVPKLVSPLTDVYRPFRAIDKKIDSNEQRYNLWRPLLSTRTSFNYGVVSNHEKVSREFSTPISLTQNVIT